MKRLEEFRRFLRFCAAANRAYQLATFAKDKGTAYVTVGPENGVPEIAIFVGIGREAWQITQRAIEYQQVK